MLPTYQQIKPVDTTGAGDAFCAGFLCGLAQGWDFRKSGAFANADGRYFGIYGRSVFGIKDIGHRTRTAK